jgi:ABC-type transporter Mla MlaB component
VDLTINEAADKTEVLIAGPVRLGEVPTLLEQLQALHVRSCPVEINLRMAEHLHTAAWQVLVALDRSLEARGLALHFAEVSDSARSVIVDVLNRQKWIDQREGVD